MLVSVFVALLEHVWSICKLFVANNVNNVNVQMMQKVNTCRVVLNDMLANN